MRHILRRLRSDDAGTVALLFALTLPLVAGGAALGVETTYWYFKDLELQAAADAAAYAAAIDKRAGADDAEIAAAAEREAVANGFVAADGELVINSPPTSGSLAGSAEAVEVTLRSPVQRFFTRIFDDTEVVVEARSVAAFQTASNACVLALHPSAAGAVTFSGSSNVNLEGCSVMANSVAANAVVTQGSGRLSTTCVISVGGVSLAGGGLSMSDCDTPVTQAPPVADPYRDVPEPSVVGACKSVTGDRPGAHTVLSPGIYCGGMRLQGNVRLEPGVYVVTGGNLRIDATATVTGEGVTFFLNGSAGAQINGSSTVRLSAPTSGTYAGVLFMGDRESTGATITINGNNSSQLTGAIYFPNNPVQYLGNFSGENGCTQVVARTLLWSGSAGFNADCTEFGMQTLPVMALIKLAE